MDERLASVEEGSVMQGDKKRDDEEEKREKDNVNANFEFRVAIYAELSSTFVIHANGTRATFFSATPVKRQGRQRRRRRRRMRDSRRAVTFF